MTLLLSRAKTSHYLTIVLIALLAFPTNLPTLERRSVRTDLESFTPSLELPGLALHKPDRKSPHRQADWSVDVDEPESSGVGDDFRATLLALPHRSFDLPSLVPVAIDLLTFDPAHPVITSTFTPPLRC